MPLKRLLQKSFLKPALSSPEPQVSEGDVPGRTYTLDRYRKAKYHSSKGAESNRDMYTGPLEGDIALFDYSLYQPYVYQELFARKHLA